ncbi:MAG: hypothetical protein ACKVT0_20260, partial [Planctomycetaceae bacterium]
MSRLRLLLSIFVIGVLAVNIPLMAADVLKIDLAKKNSAKDWMLLDKTAKIENGELVFDGRKKISRAIFTPLEWSDVT